MKNTDLPRPESFVGNKKLPETEGLFKKYSPKEDNSSEHESLFRKSEYEIAPAEDENYSSGLEDEQSSGIALAETKKMRHDLNVGRKSQKNFYGSSAGGYPKDERLMDDEISAAEHYYYNGEYRRVIEIGMRILYKTFSLKKKFKICSMIANSYAAIGSPEQGARILKEFVDNFPEDENAATAKMLIGKIVGRAYEGSRTYDYRSPYDRGGRMHESERSYDRYRPSYGSRDISARGIGCLLPLSGPYEIYGKKALKGIQLALMNFGSRDNSRVKIIIKDTGSNREMSLEALRELDKNNVSAIIGPLTYVDSAAKESQARKIPIVTLTQKENITDIGDYVFRNFLTPMMQVDAIVNYAFNKLGIRRFAVLYPDEKYGRTFMRLFHDQVMSYGGSIVGAESYDVSETDFAGPIKRLANLYYERLENSPELTEKESADYEAYKKFLETEADPDKGEHEIVLDCEAIFIPESPKKAGLIMPQLAFHDIKNVYFFGTNLWHSKEFIDMAKEYVQGAIMPDSFFKDNPAKETRKFVADFIRTFDEEPGFIEALTYDTATILFKLVSRPDALSRKRLRNAIMSMRSYPGVTGITSFYQSGDVWKNIYLLKIKNSRFVPLEID